VIFDARDRLFLVRRALDRSLFPGSWDVVGGHVEPGESARAALDRELREETGWQVGTVLAELPPWTWTGDDGRPRVEYDYLISVTGDLGAPRLDAAEHSGYRWLTESELSLLDDDPSLIRQLADAAAPRGSEFLAALYALHEEVLRQRWRGATVARAS
jgi:8-oxo-dGTP diphosphatase